MSSNSQYRIGQVCDLLRPEFPDISISKLRFLEEQGLVEPRRTPGGYRMYEPQHIRELRQILAMQRDEFLPLKVIRQELQRRLGEGAGRRAGNDGSDRVSLTGPDEMLTLDQVCQRSGVTPEFVEECRTADIISGVRDANGEVCFSRQEAGLVNASAQMQRLGIDIRHLRQVRTAVGRQAALVEQYAAARLRAPNQEARASAVRNVESLTQSLAEFMRLAFVRDVRSMTARAVAGPAASTIGNARPLPLS